MPLSQPVFESSLEAAAGIAVRETEVVHSGYTGNSASQPKILHTGKKEQVFCIILPARESSSAFV